MYTLNIDSRNVDSLDCKIENEKFNLNFFIFFSQTSKPVCKKGWQKSGSKLQLNTEMTILQNAYWKLRRTHFHRPFCVFFLATESRL